MTIIGQFGLMFVFMCLMKMFGDDFVHRWHNRTKGLNFLFAYFDAWLVLYSLLGYIRVFAAMHPY